MEERIHAAGWVSVSNIPYVSFCVSSQLISYQRNCSASTSIAQYIAACQRKVSREQTSAEWGILGDDESSRVACENSGGARCRWCDVSPDSDSSNAGSRSMACVPSPSQPLVGTLSGYSVVFTEDACPTVGVKSSALGVRSVSLLSMCAYIALCLFAALLR